MNDHRINALFAIVVAGAVLTTGCATFEGEQRNVETMRLRAEIANLRVDVDRLNSRADGLAAAQEDLYGTMDALQ